MSLGKNPHVLILGSGIAGLTCALKFARQDYAVTIVSKSTIDEGATRYAQGGIASVWSKSDSFEDHIHDTLEAGAGLCRTDIVSLCVSEGPARVRELIDWGVPFTREAQGAFDLHIEGGHGKRRILHADDLTGLAIEKTLIDRVRAEKNIRVLEHAIAVDLITEEKLFRDWLLRKQNAGRCLGAYILTQDESIETLSADITVLATGGAGKVYLYTSNPDTATGDGIAMARRAGAQVANLEFIQFHPTCLYHPEARTFLISEALRGEGAVLKTLDGESFMSKYHPQGSLAPRDIVARAIDMEMKRTGDKYVHLDATHLTREEAQQKFPNIFETCLKFGIDLSQQPIPVVPAAHYTCGGVLTDENGVTSIPNLYAIGEVACTGLHGANRLASNSLLEGAVFAHRVVEHAVTHVNAKSEAPALPQIPAWDTGQAVPVEEQIDIAATWLEIRQLMWNYVGIVRSNRRLERARARLTFLKAEINQYYWSYLLTRDLIELRNLITVAELIVECASLRKESRGLHYTVDYPERDDAHFMHDTIVGRRSTSSGP